MPYIKQEKRRQIDPLIENLFEHLNDEGDFNYTITKLMHKYIHLKGLKYQHCNAIMGVVECAKQEFYRKVVSKYEEKKIQENGRVSDLD